MLVPIAALLLPLAAAAPQKGDPALVPAPVSVSSEPSAAPSAPLPADSSSGPSPSSPTPLEPRPSAIVPNATSSTPSPSPSPNTTAADGSLTSVLTFNNLTFVNKGLVGYGALAADMKDFFNQPIGAIGAIQLVSFDKANNGTGPGYTGQLLVQPDAGGVDTNTSYTQRYTWLDFELAPLDDTANATASNTTFNAPTSPWSIKYKEFGARWITGEAPAWPGPPNSTDPVPHPAENNTWIVADAEGLFKNTTDNTFWVADEYAPSLLRFSQEGVLIGRVAPPPAFVPRHGADGDGVVDYTATPGVDRGRAPDRGFSGLTAGANHTLYVLLESALLQDSVPGADGRYTRLLAYNITNTAAPTLAASYVVELPVDSAGKTLPAGELHYLADNTFALLAGDVPAVTNNTTANDTPANNITANDTTATTTANNTAPIPSTPQVKRFYVFSTSGATDIAATNYTTTYTPVAPNNTLVPGITAAAPTPWINILDATQLARFGAAAAPDGVAVGEWNSMAFASCEDETAPDDYFLFSLSNNAFSTRVHTQALVWRVTLPYGIEDA